MYKGLFLFFLLAVFQKTVNAQLFNTGQNLFIADSGLVFVIQDFTHSAGNTLNNGRLIIKGNLYNRDNSSKIFKKASKGKVILSGADQKIAGLNGISFPTLELSGTGTKFLEQPADIMQELHLNGREFIINQHTLSVANANFNAIQRTSGFINTDGGGRLERLTNSGGPYLFPFGSSIAKNYRPITIEPRNSEPASFAATLYNNDPSVNGYSVSSKRQDVSEVFSKYFFLVDQVAGSQNANVRFFMNSAEDGDYKQLTNWNKLLLWEKAAPSVAEDKNFNDGLDRNLLYTSTQQIRSLPITFAKATQENDPLTFFNAFSPDGDGKNDRWEVKNIDLFPDNELTVMNRWGDEVFKSKTYTSAKAWDGANVNAGTYYYVMKVNVNGAFKIYKGFISMIKKE